MKMQWNTSLRMNLSKKWVDRHSLRWLLLLLTFSLVSLGVIFIFSSSVTYGDHTNHTFLIKHFVWLLFGGLGALIASQLRASNFKPWSSTLIVISVLLLITGFVFEHDGGAARWLIYRNSGKMFTVSDFVRPAIIIYTAYFIDKHFHGIKNSPKFLLQLLLVLAIPISLILLQPALSASVAISCIVLMQLFFGDVKLRFLGILFTLVVLVGILSILNNPYQIRRVEAILKSNKNKIEDQATKDATQQLSQSHRAIANGGFFGQSVGASEMKNNRMPERHTDFIFAILAEEFGFLRSFFVIALYLGLFFVGVQIAIRQPDPFTSNLALGIVASIIVYAYINFSYTLGILPPTGIPLPFISYGGSHTVVNLTLIGVLYNLNEHSTHYPKRRFRRVV